MENIRLTFSSEAAAIEALRLIWIEIVKDESSKGTLAKSSAGAFYDNLSNFSDAQIVELKLVGRVNGEFVRDNGTTVAFAEAQKCYNIEKWHIPKPANQDYMATLVSYGEEPYDQAWEPPEE